MDSLAELEKVESYGKNDFIDAKDEQGDWRVGYIVQCHPLTRVFRVRFDGWDSKFDEFESAKLQPFRSIVVGYTGKKLTFAQRPSWKFSLPSHQERQEIIQTFLKNIFSYSPFIVTQLLRGSMYCYSDFLLTNKYQSSAQFDVVLHYFHMIIGFITRYLKDINQNFEQFLEAWQRPIVTAKDAYKKSYFQVLDTMSVATGDYQRFAQFFKSNQKLIQQCIMYDKNPMKVYQSYLCRQFVHKKGLEYIFNILQQLQNSKNSAPLLFICKLASLITLCVSTILFTQQQLQNMIKLLLSATTKVINNIHDQGFKYFHKKQVTELLTCIMKIGAKTNILPSVKEFTSKTELDVCLKMAMCPFFEKRIKGLAGLQECWANPLALQNNKLQAWIHEVRLVQTLFHLNDNPQLIKKSGEIIKLLIQKRLVTDDMISAIWESRVGKHQASLQQLYTFFHVFPLHEPDESRHPKVFQMLIQNIDITKMDEPYVQMIMEYTKNALYKPRPQSTFGYSLLYEYLLDKKTIFALNTFIQVLKSFMKTTFLDQVIQKFFQSIKQKNNQDIHMKLMSALVQAEVFIFPKALQGEVSIKDIILQYLLNDPQQISPALTVLNAVLKANEQTLISQQFQALWRLFVRSPKQNQFMDWIMKQRQNLKVTIVGVHKRFRSKLLQNLWNMPEKCANMSKLETLFFIELVKSVNIAEGKMKRSAPLSIQVYDIKIIGYDKIWEMIKMPNPQVGLLIDFLADFHTSAQPQCIHQSVEELIIRLQHGIKKACQTHDRQLLQKMLKFTQSVMDKDDDIYHIIPLTQSLFNQDYVIACKEKQKTIRLNKFATLYDCKKIIASKFQMPLHTFDIVEKEEILKKYNYFRSLQQLNLSLKLNLKVREVTDTPLKLGLVKNLELFFGLLGDSQVQRIVWSIVSKLPTSLELKEQSFEHIYHVLKNEGLYRQLYLMRVMLQLKSGWWKQFATSSHLQLLLSKYSSVQFQSDMGKQYFSKLTSLILNLLIHYMRSENKKQHAQEVFPLSMQLLNRMLAEVNCTGDVYQCKIISNVFNIGCLTSSLTNPLLWVISQNIPNFLFETCLLKLKNVNLRVKMLAKIKELLQYKISPPQQYRLLEAILVHLFSRVVELKKQYEVKEYFLFASFLLTETNNDVLQVSLKNQISSILPSLIKALEEQPCEINFDQPNHYLVGCLILLKRFIPFEKAQNKSKVIQFILQKSLFDEVALQCKSREARTAAFDVLNVLINGQGQIQHYIMKLLKEGSWRKRKAQNWTISQLDKIKSSTGYVGLVNLGSICYMNSLLQQLYMIPKFRYQLLSCVDQNYQKKSQRQNLLFQLQKMFVYMQFADSKAYNPRDFCYSFKDYDGKPTNVHEQMDIDQFSGRLFDKLQQQLKGTKIELLIKKTFGGVFSNQIVCKGCPHLSQSEETFLSLGLAVKGKRNIQQSLQIMVKGDTLDGENAYFCERCGKKVAAQKRVCLKQLPDYLIIALKRFDFDYQTMTKQKINDYCQFPMNLDLIEYSQQFLRKQEGSKVKAKIIEEEHPPQYFQYSIKGVVVHVGSADSGHYYSLIQDRLSANWFEFNDSTVRQFSLQNLAQESFGSNPQAFARPKVKNAYIVLYERNKKNYEPFLQQPEKIFQLPFYQQIFQQVEIQNKKQKIQNVLFSRQFFIFISNILDKIEQKQKNMQLKLLKFVVSAFLTVHIREKAQSLIYVLLAKIHNIVKQHFQVCEFILELFCDSKIYDELIAYNPIKDTRTMLVFWLIDLFPLVGVKSAHSFIHALMERLGQGQNTNELCFLLSQISFNQIWLRNLIKIGIVGVLMRNLKGETKREPLNYTAWNDHIGYECVPTSETKKKPSLQNGFMWTILNNANKIGLLQHSNQQTYPDGYPLNGKLPLSKLIHPSQLQSIEIKIQSITKFFEQLRPRVQMQALIQFLAVKATHNESFSLFLMKMIEAGIKTQHTKFVPAYFRMFEQLIRIDDQLHVKRLQGLEGIISAIQSNSAYSLDSNIVQQWVIILLVRNEILRESVASSDHWRLYLSELPSKKLPQQSTAVKYLHYQDCMINKLYGLKFPTSHKGYVKLAKLMEAFYADLLLEKNEISKYWDCPITFDRRNIRTGDKLIYFDQKDTLAYEPVIVQEYFLGRVKLKTEKNKIFAIWRDNEKLFNDDASVHHIDEPNQSDFSQTTDREIEDEQFTTEP